MIKLSSTSLNPPIRGSIVTAKIKLSTSLLTYQSPIRGSIGKKGVNYYATTNEEKTWYQSPYKGFNRDDYWNNTASYRVSIPYKGFNRRKIDKNSSLGIVSIPYKGFNRIAIAGKMAFCLIGAYQSPYKGFNRTR